VAAAEAESLLGKNSVPNSVPVALDEFSELP